MDKLAVSYSQIKRWRFCQQSYYYAYIEEITPRRKPRPLKMGSIIHSMVEAFVKEQDWKLVHKAVTKEYKNMMEEEREYYGDLPDESYRIMEGYIKQYRKLKVSYQIIEKKLGPFPLTPATVFKMKADRLMKEGGRIYLCETKTGRKIPDEDIRIWDLQTVLYIWGLRQVGYRVDGVLWDYIRTKPPTVPQGQRLKKKFVFNHLRLSI